MRFLVDECTGPSAARWLQEQGHDVFSVYDEARGNDKDFGERIYRERQPHRGVILLRLDDERAAVKINVLRQLLASHADRLPDQYVVVTETRVRFAGG